jgi:DNA-binding PadR family transcriptional regulator
MSLAFGLLGLLEEQPRHGYELKHLHDERFGGDVKFGQVYATLARLRRDRRVDIAAVEGGSGPERKRYIVTPDGVADLEQWLTDPQPPAAYGRSDLLARVIVALMSGRSADAILDGQRAVHMEWMRRLTERKRAGDLTETWLADFELLHLEADLRWIEQAGERLAHAERSRAKKEQ